MPSDLGAMCGSLICVKPFEPNGVKATLSLPHSVVFLVVGLHNWVLPNTYLVSASLPFQKDKTL